MRNMKIVLDTSRILPTLLKHPHVEQDDIKPIVACIMRFLQDDDETNNAARDMFVGIMNLTGCHGPVFEEIIIKVGQDIEKQLWSLGLCEKPSLMEHFFFQRLIGLDIVIEYVQYPLEDPRFYMITR